MNNLNAGSESNVRARSTSRLAANQPEACLRQKRAALMLSPPRRACAFCAWTRPAVRCGGRYVDAVENAIRDGGITDLFVPVRNGHLGGEDQGTALVAVITDLQ